MNYTGYMKTLLYILVAFSFGFLLRDATGPVKLPFRLTDIKQTVTGDTPANFVPGNVEIEYKNGRFSPAEAVVPRGRYLTIVNKSDSLMWLDSDNPLLTTPRGYGLSEAIKVRMDDEGTYHISNKLNVNAKVEVKVVP